VLPSQRNKGGHAGHLDEIEVAARPPLTYTKGDHKIIIFYNSLNFFISKKSTLYLFEFS
jgi:hypothetical protein